MTAASEASESGHYSVAATFFPFFLFFPRFSVNDFRDTGSTGYMNLCRHVALERFERLEAFGPQGPPPCCASVRQRGGDRQKFLLNNSMNVSPNDMKFL